MTKRLLRWLDRSVEASLFVLFVAMVLVGGLQVFNRFVLNQSIGWSEEFQRFAHIWLVFLAIPVAYNRKAHIGMTVLLERFPRRVRSVIAAAVELAWLTLAGALVVYTGTLMGVARFQSSPSMGIRMDLIYLGMLLGGAYLALVVLRHGWGRVAHAAGRDSIGA